MFDVTVTATAALNAAATLARDAEYGDVELHAALKALNDVAAYAAALAALVAGRATHFKGPLTGAAAGLDPEEALAVAEAVEAAYPLDRPYGL